MDDNLNRQIEQLQREVTLFVESVDDVKRHELRMHTQVHEMLLHLKEKARELEAKLKAIKKKVEEVN